MPSSTNRSLFLQVGADVSSLTTQMKAGRTALLTLGEAAGDVQDEVNKALAKVAADPNALKQIEASYKATFDNIRKNAQAALAVNDNASALKLIDATGAQEAAKAATAQASQLRVAADAAATVAARQGEAGVSARVLAAALEVQAIDAAKVATALRAQAGVLAEVAAEAKIAGAREDELGGSHARMGASGLITEHVIRSLSDSIAAGQSPVRALTMEMGRITEAMTMFANDTNASEGALAKFAAFMGGPWGIAISVGVAVLTPLIAGLIEGGNAAQDEMIKLRDNATQTALAAAAKEAFLHTEQGAADAVRMVTDELNKQNEALKTQAERQNIVAKRSLITESQTRSNLVGQIADTQRDLDLTKAGPASDAAGAKVSALEIRLQQLRTQLASVEKDIAADAKVRVRSDADLAGEAAKRDADPLEQIKKKYEGADGLIEQAKKRAIAEGTVTSALTRQLTVLAQQQKAETEAEQKRQRDANRTSNNDDVGRTINFAQAKDIVESVGGRVTSAPSRSLEEQQRLYDKYMAYKDGSGPWAALAAKPGTSLHGTGQAIDVAKSADVSLGELKEAFKEAGVHLTEALDEGDHYHLGYGKKGPRGPSAETLAKRQQAVVTRGANDDRSYENAGRQADDAIAHAKLQLGGSLDAEYKVRLAQIDSELVSKNQALQDEVTAKRLTQSRADELKLKNTQLALLQDQFATEQLRVAEAKVAYDDDRDARSARLALLQIDASLADTRQARLTAEQKSLVEEQAQRRADLALTVSTSKDPDAVARAKTAQGRLPEQETAENANLAKQNEDPFAKYKDELHSQVGDMNDALKGLEVQGLKGVEDGFVGIVTGSETAGQAIRKFAAQAIEELAKIGFEKLAFSIFGLSDGGRVPGYASGGLPGFAGGSNPFVSNGMISGSGTGTSDSIIAMVGKRPIRVSAGEAIVNARGVQKHWPMIDAINHDRLPAFADGGFIDHIPTGYPALPSPAAIARPAAPPQIIYMQVDKSELFNTHVTRLTAPLAQAAMVGGAAQASQDFADQRMAQIP